MKTSKRDVILGSAGEGATSLIIDITAKSKVAYISIKGHISNWRNSSADMETKIKDVVKKGATTAELYINSGGGDVFEANEILNLIEDNFTTVNVKLGALCASAATIFIAHYPTSCKKNTKIMIHKPSVYASGNEDKLASSLKLLKTVTADYKKMYASKMNITEKEVEDLWAKGDYWLTAKEALKKGLINEIENTNAPIDANTLVQLQACGAPNLPEQKPKNNIMDKLKLIALLGLDPEATDAQIEAAIKANKVAAQKTASLEAKVKAETEASKVQKVKALLDGAEKDKKITAAQRPAFEALANADFDNAKNVIDGMQPVEAISGQLDNKGSKGAAAQANWTYDDYQKNNAMADFEKLSDDKQASLIDAHYKE